MATVFPFNKIPQIPLSIISVLIPVFIQQKKILNKLNSDLQQKVDGLSKNATCGDAEINAINNDIEQLKKVAINIQALANLLQPISSGLKTAVTVANILIPIQLAIPAIVGVPEGPKQQLLTALAELISNITVVLNMLNTIVSEISNINNQNQTVISLAESKIKSVCNDPISTLASDSLQVSSTNLQGIADIQLNSEYPSEFYNDINVSDSDIRDRILQIQELVSEQQNVLQNLIEAPSKVITGTGAPSEELGNIGDYYVDTNTQTVYGPKTSQNSWT